MSDLRELYQEMILDHSKKPRNFREMSGADHVSEGFNPLCGDKIKLFMKIDKGIIKEICFQGSGCAISKASASMMTDSVKEKTIQEAEELFQKFHQMLSGVTVQDQAKLGKLSVFSGVCEFPMRVKCATLAWHTLRSALHGDNQKVSTEE